MTAKTLTSVFAPAATRWCGIFQHQQGAGSPDFTGYPTQERGATTGDMVAEGVHRIARVTPHA